MLRSSSPPMRRLGVVAGLLLAPALACDEGPTAPERMHEPIQTDKLRYIATVIQERPRTRVRFRVVAEFTNRSGEVIWLARCTPDYSHPIYGVEMVGSGEPAYSLASRSFEENGCLSHADHIRVEPGSSRSDTITLHGPVTRDPETNEVVDRLEGRMRLTYDAHPCPPEDCSERLPREERMSNAFDVALPDGIVVI